MGSGLLLLMRDSFEKHGGEDEALVFRADIHVELHDEFASVAAAKHELVCAGQQVAGAGHVHC